MQQDLDCVEVNDENSYKSPDPIHKIIIKPGPVGWQIARCIFVALYGYVSHNAGALYPLLMQMSATICIPSKCKLISLFPIHTHSNGYKIFRGRLTSATFHLKLTWITVENCLTEHKKWHIHIFGYTQLVLEIILTLNVRVTELSRFN